MDMITLAMAKAYTDKAVSEGGGGGLPIVELTTFPTPDGAELTITESEQLDALNGMPCILLCTVYDGTNIIPFRVVIGSYNYGNYLYYSAVSVLGSLDIEHNTRSGSWKFYVRTEWGS